MFNHFLFMTTHRRFTSDWFSNNIPKWTVLLAHLKGKPNIRGLEIGVFQGRSTCWLADHIFTDATARLDAVDTFEGSEEHAASIAQEELSSLYDTFLHNTREFGERVRAHRMRSSAFLRRQADEAYYDFIYVDGDHHSYACLEDMVLAWPLLKPGGIMIIDDYGGGEQQTSPHEIPRYGVDAFLHAYTTLYEVVDMGYQMVLRKKC
jgi:predicted O-methyltransferase YrrM